MNLVDKVLQDPEIVAAPPVLVDIGAAGGVHQAWRGIARHCIGVGFEPDSREAAPLSSAQRLFSRWVFIPGIAVPHSLQDASHDFFLTRSPQCSSVLRPNTTGLSGWAFAELFEVVDRRAVPAVGLLEGLQAQGIEHVDWIKCDTQGMDLRLFASLPTELRWRVLSVEMEPGFIDAYEGEDGIADVLQAMKREPYWLARCDVQSTSRGSGEILRALFGENRSRRYAAFGPGAPGWANLLFLRDFSREEAKLGRREYLLGWCFAVLERQPAAALEIAIQGRERFGGELLAVLERRARLLVRMAFWRGWLRAVRRRLLRR